MNTSKVLIGIGLIALVAGCESADVRAAQRAGDAGGDSRRLVQGARNRQARSPEPVRTAGRCAASTTDRSAEGRARAARESRAGDRASYPADGKCLGDFKAGERIAQTGVGMQWSATPPPPSTAATATHATSSSKQEIAFGNIGPSLYNYAKMRGTTKRRCATRGARSGTRMRTTRVRKCRASATPAS